MLHCCLWYVSNGTFGTGFEHSFAKKPEQKNRSERHTCFLMDELLFWEAYSREVLFLWWEKLLRNADGAVKDDA